MNEQQDGASPEGERKWKAVYTIVEGGANRERKVWIRVGTAFTNRDTSINVRLDAIPTNGTLHIRDWEPPGERRRDEPGPQAGRGVM